MKQRHFLQRLQRHPATPKDGWAAAFHVVCSHTNAEFVGFHLSHASEVEPRAERRSRAAFEQKGIRLLLAAEPGAMGLFEDKAAVYAGLDTARAAAPRAIKVNTADEFVAACETLRAEGHKVCFKPSCSTGGLGFRILDDDAPRPATSSAAK